MQTKELSIDLLSEIKTMIEESRKQVAMAVNVALSVLHWKIGKKINEAIESKNRSERYGQEIVASLVRQLSTDYGTAFSEKNIRKMMQFARIFPNEEMMVEGENLPIGLILCASKDEEHIELLKMDKSNIRVAEYLTILPDKKLLEEKLRASIERAKIRLSQ
jgi:hypothetical protein